MNHLKSHADKAITQNELDPIARALFKGAPVAAAIEAMERYGPARFEPGYTSVAAPLALRQALLLIAELERQIVPLQAQLAHQRARLGIWLEATGGEFEVAGQRLTLEADGSVRVEQA